MADKIEILIAGDQTPIPVLYRDLGNGTYAIATAFVSGNTSAGGIALSGRLQGAQAPSTPATGNLTIGNGNLQPVTGSTQINRLDTTGWQAGSLVVLQFSSALVVKDGQTASGAFAPIQLAGDLDFTSYPGASLALVYNGTYWAEVGRTPGTNPVDTTAPVEAFLAAVNTSDATGLAGATVTITWTTNEPADTQVEYGLTSAYGSLSPLDTAMSSNHAVVLTGLTADTVYHFRMLSRDAAGNLATGSDIVFQTNWSLSQLAMDIWLEENLEALADEAAVVTPTDWSGAATGFTQGTGIFQPAHDTLAFGDKAGARFAANQYWSTTRAATAALRYTGDRTYVFLWKGTMATDGRIISYYDTASGVGYSLAIGQSVAGRLSVYHNGGGFKLSTGPALNTGKPVLVIVEITGTTLNIYYDGVLADTFASVSSGASTTDLPYIGVDPGLSALLSGHIGLYASKGAVLTADQKAQLVQKYAS